MNNNNITLGGMSAEALESLSARALALARDLRASEPSYELALANGVRDHSYSTVRWGTVASYGGEATITMADGSLWRAVGYGPRGTAEYVSRDGGIEMIPLAKEEEK